MPISLEAPFEREVRRIILNNDANNLDTLKKDLKTLSTDIEEFRENFLRLKASLPKELELSFSHVDEFILQSIEYYLCGLLEMCPNANVTDEIKQVLSQNDQYQKEKFPIKKRESILLRNSLLAKYIREVLQLKSTRVAVQEKHGAAFGAIAAGIAMFLYTTLFAMAFFSRATNPLITTSFPVILTIVLLYILKDRVKEGLKNLYQNRASFWFPDFSTDILDPSGNKIGDLKETVQFLKSHELPPKIKYLRENNFSEELPDIKRFETVIKYKREVILYKQDPKADPRLKDLNILFRFNIHHLIAKASDTLPLYLSFNQKTNSVEKMHLPKVYHLNMVITSNNNSDEKYRVVVDKLGIKRVEKL